MDKVVKVVIYDAVKHVNGGELQELDINTPIQFESESGVRYRVYPSDRGGIEIHKVCRDSKPINAEPFSSNNLIIR